MRETLRILETEITKNDSCVRPGRNVAVIIEVAAMNYRLNIMGINTAEEFNERLNAEILRKMNIKRRTSDDVEFGLH